MEPGDSLLFVFFPCSWDRGAAGRACDRSGQFRPRASARSV